MAETIDKVQLEVTATANGATQVVNNLVSSLKTLQSALSSLDTSKLTKATQSVNKTFVNTSGMSKAEKDISSSVNKIKQALAGLESYKNAALSGDSSSLTSFNRRVISIQSSIDTLKEKFSQLGNTSVPTTAFSNLDTQIEATKTKLEELKAKAESMGGKAVDLGDLVSVQTDIQNTESELDTLIAKQQELINSGQAYTDPFATYRDGLDEVQQSLSSAKSEIDRFNSSTNESGGSTRLSSLADAISSVADKASEATGNLLKMTASGIKSGFSTLKSKLSGIKDTLSSISGSTSSGVASAFSKILKYGFGIRSLYVLFRRLKTAIKDSFTELQNSGAYYQTTKANVEALKNSLTTLKYQFGAAFEPIFNTVAPALQTLINYLVTVMNTISAFIAKLTGKSTYSKAVVATSEIASNTGSAAGSAAELNKQLQGFDELNNLDLDSGSSGGSGSSGSSDSSNVTYVEESVDSALTSFWNSLSDAITSGDWYEAGTLISNALTDALNSINWDSNFESASNFGTGLAESLNGLITDDLFSALGTTIANAIKTALIAAISFGETFDWTGLGTAIASGINAFVEQNPLSLLVTAFNVWANGILDTLIAAVQNIKWDDIAQQIADAISNLDVSGITWKLGTLASSLANALYTLVSNKETWTNLGTKIGEGITSFFKSMNQTDASTGLTGWQALGETISSVFSGIKETIKKALENVEWSEVGKAIVDFIGALPLGDIAITIAGISATMAVTEAAKTALKTYLTSEAMTLIGGLGTVSGGTVAVSVVLAAVIGWKIGGKLYESATGYEGASQGFVKTVEDLWDGLFSDNKIEFNLTDFINFTIDDVNNGTGWLKDTGLWSTLTTVRDSIKSAWESLTGTETSTKGYNGAPSEAVKYIESTGQGDTTSYWHDLGKNIVNGIVEGVKLSLLTNPFTAPVATLYEYIKTAICDKFGIESPAKAMYDYGKNIFLGIIEGFKEEMNSYGWDDLASDLSDLFNGTSTTKTGSTAQGDFNRSTDKTHSKTGGNSTTYTINTKLTGEAKNKTDLENLKTSFSNLTTESSKSTESEYKTKVGGQITSIDDLATWKTKFKNLYNAWVGKSVTLKALEDGIANNKIQGWINSFNELKKKWTGKDAKLTTSEDGLNNGKVSGWIKTLGEKATEWVGKSSKAIFSTVESGLSNFDGKTGYKARLDEIQSKWQGEGQNRTATFTTNTAGNLSSTTDMSNYASATQNLYDHFHGGDHSSSWSTSLSGDVASMNAYASAAGNIYQNFYSGEHYGSWNITTSLDSNTLDNATTQIANSLLSKVKEKYNSTNWSSLSGRSALGGTIVNGVLKHNIPQYAGGTLNAGSVFVAGEHGPEVMGHINGRTEILNRSQIASIMNNSFVNAMAQFGNRMLTSPETVAYKASGYQSYNPGGNSSNDNLLLAEQNQLLREQNDLISQLLDKPTGVSSRDVFNAVRSESSSYYNRTGNSPFLF